MSADYLIYLSICFEFLHKMTVNVCFPKNMSYICVLNNPMVMFQEITKSKCLIRCKTYMYLQ